MKKVLHSTLSVLFLVFANPMVGFGQISIAPGGTITQNFDGMGATSTLPSNWKINAESAANTRSSYAASGTTTANTGGNAISTSAASGTYKFRANNTNENSLGGLSASSSNRSINISTYLSNSGASSITNFTIAYDIEKFRNGQRNFIIQLYYSTDGTTWTSAGSNFLTTFSADADNNGYTPAPGSSVSVSNTLTTTVAPGGALYLQWHYTVETGTSGSNAIGLGIDNISITANASSNPTVNLSINATTGTEASSTYFTLTATASSAVSGAKSVDVDLTGTGLTAGDFRLDPDGAGPTPPSAITFPYTLTIASGQTTANLGLMVFDDAVYECTETATFTISNPTTGMTLGSTTAQNFSITDNDLPTVNLSTNTTTGSETAMTSITLTATASAAVIGAQTVTVGLSGTGLTNADFSSVTFPATITIVNGASTGTLTFTIADDAAYEGTENATFTISSPSSCIALGATTTQGLAITDNDFPSVNLSINTATGSEAATTSITLTATASAAVTGDQTVNVALSGTGLTASDFTGIDFSTTQTITILNGATTGTRTFAVADDATYECTETATFTISAPTSGIVLGATTTRTHAITDNDFPTINLSINTTSGSEAATTSITLTATASAAVIGAQTVSVALSGTGLANADFSGITFPATITIANGATTGTRTFTIVDDTAIEGDETATFTISSPSACAALGATTAQNLTIVENDFPAAPCADLFISEYVEGSGSNKYIEIYNPTSNSIDLSIYNLRLYANGASSPTNDIALSGTITAYGTVVYQNSSASIYTGSATNNAAVNFNGDDAVALAKNGTNIDIFGRIGDDPGSAWTSGAFTTLDKSLVRNAAVQVGIDANPTGTGSGAFTTLSTEWTQFATDNVTNLGSHTCNCFVANPTVNLSINTTTGAEATSTSITLTATASAAVVGNQTVQITLSGTGVTNADFASVTFPATITILSGASTGSITFTVFNDVVAEGTETATFTMGSSSSGITIGTTFTHNLTITDDDNLTSSASVITNVGNEAASISSLTNGTITTSTQGTQVWQFRLNDGDGSTNDADTKPTIYQQWVIRPSAGNTVPDWSTTIDNVKFFQDATGTPIPGAFLVNAASISFLPSTPITVADNGSALISMRITLDNPLAAGSDGRHFGFSIVLADVTIETNVLLSSQLGTFSPTSNAALNGIDITATLQFINAPATVGLGDAFTITVSAIDANGNIDSDNTSLITLAQNTGTGVLTGAGAHNLVAGTYTWSGLSYDTEELFQAIASGGGFSPITANINVVDEDFQLFDHFNRPDGYVVGIPSSGGSTSWTETESGDGTKIQLFNGMLLLDNCVASDPSGSSGGTTTERIAFNVENHYETVYNNGGGTLNWLFNMRSNNSNLSGWAGSAYAMAVILGCDQADFTAAGSDGYAVAVGNSGTTDYIKLIHFTNGLNSDANVTDIVSSNIDIDANHASVKVSFNPCNGEWTLYARNDGSSFVLPNLPSPAYAGPFTATNTTHTALDLKYFGAAWKHNSSCSGNDAYFDNFSIPNVSNSSSTGKTWNGSVSANWNVAANWGPCPGVPTASDNVTIPNVATQPIVSVTPAAVCNSLTVNSGADLTINSGQNLSANGAVVNNGIIYVNNGANFIQTLSSTSYSGSGQTVVRRQGNSAGGYNAWSSPVVGAAIPGNNKYWYSSSLGTNSNADDVTPYVDPGWQSNVPATMTAGVGYYSTDAGFTTFSGQAHNGSYTPSVITSGLPANSIVAPTYFNLIGNPYPSSLNADLFISQNASRIDGALYFWSDENAGSAAYSTDDFATYSTGGLIVPLTGGGSSGAPVPSIPSCQGFFVRCTNSGTINFNNGQRGGSNNQFFRMAAPDHQRIWLSINNEALQLFNQTLVAFSADATDQKDWGVDALKMRGNSAIALASVQDEDTYVIATFADIPDNGKVVPLMTYVHADGVYTFVADSMVGFESRHVYLEDLSTGQLFPMQQGDAHSFHMSSADEFNRFQLWFSPATVTGLEEVEDQLQFYATNDMIVVETASSTAVKGTLRIVDMAGRLILNQGMTISNGIGRLQTGSLATGIYAVSFMADNNEIQASEKMRLGN